MRWFNKSVHHDMSHGWVELELFKLFVWSLWHYETMAQKQLNPHITLSLPHLWGQIQPSSSTHIHTLMNKKRAASMVGRHGTITGFKVYRWLEKSWFKNLLKCSIISFLRYVQFFFSWRQRRKVQDSLSCVQWRANEAHFSYRENLIPAHG